MKKIGGQQKCLERLSTCKRHATYRKKIEKNEDNNYENYHEDNNGYANDYEDNVGNKDNDVGFGDENLSIMMMMMMMMVIMMIIMRIIIMMT